MSPADPADHLPLHALTFRILIELSGGPSFGTAIVRRIESVEPSVQIYPANLFRRIRDLQAEGLVEPCESPPGADPRRTYIRLTDTGRSVARLEARRLDALLADARHAHLLSDG